ncbi:MAG: hypothetical protein IPP25_14805 [Saprospiraceae bacterium]|nr:hypothetical protein [Candidatus Opimibacter skivensis]
MVGTPGQRQKRSAVVGVLTNNHENLRWWWGHQASGKTRWMTMIIQHTYLDHRDP